MPSFLKQKLMATYGDTPTVFKMMNAIGAVKGNKETPKGRAMQTQHNADVKAGTGGTGAALASHPNARNLGKFLHPKRAR